MGRNVLTAARRRTHNRNINPFDLLYNEPVCFRCHNYGHKTVDCKLKENKADQSVKYTGTYGERKKRLNAIWCSQYRNKKVIGTLTVVVQDI